MFFIDSGYFLNDPLSFGFNTTKKIFLFLHVFDFQGPFECQTYPKKNSHGIFSGFQGS
jgi:hypothetical protein